MKTNSILDTEYRIIDLETKLNRYTKYLKVGLGISIFCLYTYFIYYYSVKYGFREGVQAAAEVIESQSRAAASSS